MADANTEKQKVKEITDKPERGLKGNHQRLRRQKVSVCRVYSDSEKGVRAITQMHLIFSQKNIILGEIKEIWEKEVINARI